MIKRLKTVHGIVTVDDLCLSFDSTFSVRLLRYSSNYTLLFLDYGDKSINLHRFDFNLAEELKLSASSLKYYPFTIREKLMRINFNFDIVKAEFILSIPFLRYVLLLDKLSQKGIIKNDQ